MGNQQLTRVNALPPKEMVSEIAIEQIIVNVMKIPGVKVERDQFLQEILSNENLDMQLVVEQGPVAAGISENRLMWLSEKLLLTRTGETSIKSFVLGIPGGVIAAATIPADILQFYAIVIKLAQELTYLYGAKNLWVNGHVDEEMVRNNLILYCGVMFGVNGAGSCVRMLSAQVAKTTLKKLPQKALTKTLWYPVIKKIGKAIGVKITKSTVAKGASKVIPVIGGVISGAFTFASMKPMAERLLVTLNQATYHYNEEAAEKDIEVMEAMEHEDVEKVNKLVKEEKKPTLIDKSKDKIKGLFKKKEEKTNDPYEEIKKLNELLDMGIITEKEFKAKKKELFNL